MSDHLEGLTHIIQCKTGGRGGWENIAAFNVRAIALAYLADCERSNSPNFYRYVQLVTPDAPYLLDEKGTRL